MCIPGNFIFSPKFATGSQNSPRRRTKQVHHGNRATTPQTTLKIRCYHRYHRPYVLYMTSTICVHHGIELGGWYIVRTKWKKHRTSSGASSDPSTMMHQYTWVPRYVSDPLHLCLTERLRCEYTTIDPTSYQEVSPSYIITDAEYVVPFLNNQLHSSSAG